MISTTDSTEDSFFLFYIDLNPLSRGGNTGVLKMTTNFTVPSIYVSDLDVNLDNLSRSDPLGAFYGYLK